MSGLGEEQSLLAGTFLKEEVAYYEEGLLRARLIFYDSLRNPCELMQYLCDGGVVVETLSNFPDIAGLETNEHLYPLDLVTSDLQTRSLDASFVSHLVKSVFDLLGMAQFSEGRYEPALQNLANGHVYDYLNGSVIGLCNQEDASLARSTQNALTMLNQYRQKVA